MLASIMTTFNMRPERRSFPTVGIEPFWMAGRAEVGRPYLRRWNAGGAELQQNRLLEIKI